MLSLFFDGRKPASIATDRLSEPTNYTKNPSQMPGRNKYHPCLSKLMEQAASGYPQFAILPTIRLFSEAEYARLSAAAPGQWPPAPLGIWKICPLRTVSPPPPSR
jgi:hypothetical protein